MKNTNANHNKNNKGKTVPAQTRQGVFKALLDSPTRENSSSFAFSFAAMFMFGLSLVAVVILNWWPSKSQECTRTPV